MTAIIIAILIVFAIVGTALRYAPPPGETIRRERERRLLAERLCDMLLAADENPMYAIPPKAVKIAKKLINPKESDS